MNRTQKSIRNPQLVVGLTILSTLSIFCTQVLALPASKISQLAKEFTVLVDSISPGTGVLLSREKNTYTVLTAAHVVEHSDYEYTVRTPDNKRHPVSFKTVKQLPGVDLAILEFTSNANYTLASIADSDQTVEGSPVFIAGFPDPGTATANRIFQFTSGEVSSRPTSGPKGYLMHYTNITRVGMSGGPVLNNSGKLVGIHGLANTDQLSGNKTGINLGIPINTFKGLAPRVGFSFPIFTAPKPLKKTPSQVVDSIIKTTAPSTTIPTRSTIPSIVPSRPKPLRPTRPLGSPVCAGLGC